MVARFVCELGESREYSYSVKQYAEYIMKNKSESESYAKAAPLSEALLNFGAYTQKYFGHSEGDPANSECANKDVSSVTAKTLEKYRITEAQGGVLIIPEGANLTLEPLMLRLYFSKVSETALTFSLDGKELEVGTKDDCVYVDIKGISLGSLDEDFKVTVSDGETVEYVKCNVFAYLRFAVSSPYESFTPEFKDTLRALYLYNKAVEDYN